MNSLLAGRTTVLALTFLPLLQLGIAASAQAQRDPYRLWYDAQTDRSSPEDTEFVLARVQFSSGRGSLFGGGGWAHDYPDAEEHILQVASEATNINLHKMSYVIVRLDSEEVFKYPFLYFSEVGEMNMTEKEVQILREYFNRGGFAMIDDFYGQWALDWFRSQMNRVFPGRDFVELSVDHPIFHTFYEVATLDGTSLLKPRRSPNPGKYYGYYDDNGRLLLIINHDNDLGDFWEWIDQPRYPLPPSTAALRIGINYLIYSMTH